MSETRRDLFKTSVLSGFGLMSASALAGCGDWRSPFTPPPGCFTGTSADSPNWMLAYGTETIGTITTSNWYVFQYVPVASAYYNAFALKKTASTLPPDPSKTNAPFDVMTWYEKYHSEFDPASGTITITVNSISYMITMRAGKITDPNSMNVLQKFPYVPCSWNEIGAS
jgi:hypothetical protein